MGMTLRQEMRIPKSSGDVIVQSVIFAIVIFFTGLAVLNIVSQVAKIPSLIWLAFIIMMVWTPVKQAGGFRRFLVQAGAVTNDQ